MKRFLTWLKPTAAQFHVWNYFGAVKPFFDLLIQNPDAEAFLMTANMHALTTLHDSERLRSNTISCVKSYVAMAQCYLWDSAERILIYNPAMIPWHAQLEWVLGCVTHMWFMQRMHAYKDAASKWNVDALSVGTFCYPILQAADVVLYDATHVPVGKDQAQHIEYTRDIAQKFNNMYGDILTIPELLVREDVATVPGIDWRKMSKSYDNFLWLLDSPEVLKKKVKLIVTDALSIEAIKNPDTCNVYNILKLFLSPVEDIVVRKRYTDWGLGYGAIKEVLYQKVVEFVTPIQNRFWQLDDTIIEQMLLTNGQKANEIAIKKIEQVYKAVWLI